MEDQKGRSMSVLKQEAGQGSPSNLVFHSWQKNHWEVYVRKTIQSSAHHGSLSFGTSTGYSVGRTVVLDCLHSLDVAAPLPTMWWPNVSSDTASHTLNWEPQFRSQGWRPKTIIDKVDVISKRVTAELKGDSSDSSHVMWLHNLGIHFHTECSKRTLCKLHLSNPHHPPVSIYFWNIYLF